MASVKVTPRRGGMRTIELDPSRERDAALIATLRRAAGRGELLSVEVDEPAAEQPAPRKAAAKKAAAEVKDEA